MRPSGQAKSAGAWTVTGGSAGAGRGDHVNYNKPGEPVVVTVDMGRKEIPIGTLRSIYRKAGWRW